MMNWGNGFGGWGIPFFGPFFMILFWALIIIGIVYLVKMLMGQTCSSTEEKRETPLDILKRDMQRARLTRRSLIKEKGLGGVKLPFLSFRT